MEKRKSLTVKHISVFYRLFQQLCSDVAKTRTRAHVQPTLSYLASLYKLQALLTVIYSAGNCKRCQVFHFNSQNTLGPHFQGSAIEKDPLPEFEIIYQVPFHLPFLPFLIPCLDRSMKRCCMTVPKEWKIRTLMCRF